MDGETDGWRDGRTERWTDGEMDGRRDGRMERRMEGQKEEYRDASAAAKKDLRSSVKMIDRKYHCLRLQRAARVESGGLAESFEASVVVFTFHWHRR